MKAIQNILGIISIAFTISAYAQPNFNWAVQNSGSLDIKGNSIDVDLNGDLCTTGSFSGTADFDPGTGVSNLTSNGIADIFIQKLDDNGNLLWVKHIGGTGNDQGMVLQSDGAGNVYVLGNFQGTVDFDPGIGTFNMTSNGGYDGFLLKLDPNGNFLWAIQCGGTGTDLPYTFDVGASAICVTGFFRNTVDFDPGVGISNLTAVGNADVFVWKLDLNGNLIWVKQMGGSGNESGRGIQEVANGDYIVSGYFANTVDFDPNVGINNLTSNGQNDLYVQKLDSNGNFLWVKQIGGASNENAVSMVVDQNGNSIITGVFNGTCDYDPGVGVTNLTSNSSSYDIFLLKLNQTGDFVWVDQMGGPSTETVGRIAIDGNNNIFLSASFQGSVDFDPGVGTNIITSNGGYDMVTAKFDSTGSHIWANGIGGLGQDISTTIALNKGVIYTGGYFEVTVDFDYTAAVYNLTSAGNKDSFVKKLYECVNSGSTFSASDCSSYTVPSGDETYTTVGSYQVKDTILNGCGKDSIMTINLTITGPSNGTDVITSCDSLQWIDGKTYYASNATATHTLTGGAYNGCDSIVTLNLTIVNATTGTDKITACNSYKWIDGKTYTSSNNTATYTIAGGAANGCDSIVTLNLTINTVNATITASNDTITASATGATYQWLDCDNNYAVISGATNQMFIATANGHYAVAVTQNGCTDTSACVTVTGVGINENSLGADVKVYPNPSNGKFTITLTGQQFQQTELVLFDITGKELNRWIIKSGKKLEINLSDKAKGLYYIQGLINNGKITKKILIQ